MENKRQFKLYVNKSNEKVWDILNSLKPQGISPSDYICNLIFNDAKIEKPQMSKVEEVEVEVAVDIPEKKENKEKYHLIFDLISLASEYEQEGIDGLSMSYALPQLFTQMKITKEQIIDLITFSTKLHIILLNTDDVKHVLTENYSRILTWKKDIDDVSKVDQFKQFLRKGLLDDPERAKKEQERLVKQEQERLKKEYERLAAEKRDLEVKQWEMANPGVPYWKKDTTEEDLQFFRDLADGKYVQDEEGRYVLAGSDDDKSNRYL